MNKTFSTAISAEQGGFPYARAEIRGTKLGVFGSWTPLTFSSPSDASPKTSIKVPLYDVGGYILAYGAFEIGAAMRYMDYRIIETYETSSIVVDVRLKTFVPLIHLGAQWLPTKSIHVRLAVDGFTTGKNIFFDLVGTTRWLFSSFMFLEVGARMDYVKMDNDDVDGTFYSMGPFGGAGFIF